MKKKVGIITFHCANNFGALLQSYALYSAIERIGYEVNIINYCPKVITSLYSNFSLFVYKRYLKKPLTLAHLMQLRALDFPNRIMKNKYFQNFINNNITLTEKSINYKQLTEISKEFDYYITGSDQVWNTDITLGFDKAYFLAFPKTGIKISYAPSIGRRTIDKKYTNDFSKYLSKFDFISVREKSGVEELQKYCNKSITQVIDPVFLLNKNDWNKIIKDVQFEVNEPYILVYMLEKNYDLIDKVNKLSNKHHMKVVAITNHKYFTNLYNAKSVNSIEQFLYLIKNASYVVTNSFHGTAFSIIYEKQMLVFPHSNSGDRMTDLLTSIGLEERLAENIKNIDNSINYKEVDKKLDAIRKYSLDYLKNSLSYKEGE